MKRKFQKLSGVFFISVMCCSCVLQSNTNSVDQEIDNSTRADAGGSGVMLQGFAWTSNKVYRGSSKSWYSVMQENASDIKDVFEYVWFPPCTDSGSENGYLPRQLNVLNSAYGTESELKTAINSIKSDYTKAIGDIVVNHRVGTTSWGDFTNPTFGTVKGQNYKAICKSDEGFTNEPNLMGKVSASMRGGADTGTDFNGGRDLDHNNKDVQDGIVTWMNSVMKAAGFSGWRYDMVGGYDGKFTGYYNAMSNAEFSVGEYWMPNNMGIFEWINRTRESVNGVPGKVSRAFDFELKGTFNKIFGSKSKNNSPDYSLLSKNYTLVNYTPGYAVTFVENHDTGSTQQQFPIFESGVAPAYAYILTHPGVPCVAWFHYFSAVQSDDIYKSSNAAQYLGSKTVPGSNLSYHNFIKKLIELRKSIGITDLSSVKILASKKSQYMAEITGEHGTVIVCLGSATNCPTGYETVVRGSDFEVFKNQ